MRFGTSGFIRLTHTMRTALKAKKLVGFVVQKQQNAGQDH